MRRVAVCLFVLCAAVGFSLNGAAADKSDVVSFGEWMDSLDGLCPEGNATPATSTMATTQSPCYVEAWCPQGAPPVSCTGTSYCTAGVTCGSIPYVECDGVRTLCSRDWCQTKLCCYAYKTCDYYCQSQGLGDIGGCSQGCCICPEL